MAFFDTSGRKTATRALNDRAAANLVLPKIMETQKKARRERVAQRRGQGQPN